MFIARDGRVIRENQNAVCLGSLPGTSFSAKDNPVLIQFSVYKERKKTYKGGNLPEASKRVLKRWFRYLVNRPDMKEGFFEHSVDFRFEVGIPIKVMGRAGMWPLMASTFCRFFWDRHNSSHAKDVLYFLDEFPDIPIDRAFIIGNLINKPFELDTVPMGLGSGVHSPFGSSLSSKRTGEFIRKQLPFKASYTKNNGNIIDWSGGINNYFSSGQKSLIKFLAENIDIPHEVSRGWGTPYLLFNMKHFKPVVTKLDKLLKELKND